VVVPWPVLHSRREDRITFLQRLGGGDVQVENVSHVLLDFEDPSRTKETLRTNSLRYHPDKFDRRVLARDEDRERVREVAMALVRNLNEMLKELAEKDKGDGSKSS